MRNVRNSNFVSIVLIEEYSQKMVTFIAGKKYGNQNLNNDQKIISNDIFAGITKAVENVNKYNRNILFSYTYRFEATDLLPLLTHPSDRKHLRFYWEQPSIGFSLAGLNTIWTWDDLDTKPYEKVIAELKSIFDKSISVTDSILIGPKLIGGKSFDCGEKHDKTWEGFPRCRFYLPECLATMTEDGAWLTISKIMTKGMSIESFYDELIQLCNHYQNRMPVTLPPITKIKVSKYRNTPNKNDWNSTICSVLEKIQPGEIKKVVISRSHQIKISSGFSVSSALQILRNKYSNCTTFMFAFPKEGIFFGSTPERLIRLNRNYIETEALAGTKARGINIEEDRLLSNTLFNSHKENEEHTLVVSQIKRKLNSIIKKIEIDNTPTIMKLTNVQHLRTQISGHLKIDKHILELVNILHPTPAVAGTPTNRAIKIIKELEKNDRGWYSGPIGWFDSKGFGEFYVALRSALVKNEEVHVFAGSGIVSESTPEKEWEETELKLQPIISALSGGQF